MAKKSKGNRIMVELESTEKTGTRYITVKNKKNDPARMELKKYDKVLKKHVLFKETK
jgi:large subunit ribosomal protein L33